jgi:hypothetical protein
MSSNRPFITALYGTAPYDFEDDWITAPASIFTLSPCAVCGFPNGGNGDSHDRCRRAIKRAERRGYAEAEGEVLLVEVEVFTYPDDVARDV